MSKYLKSEYQKIIIFILTFISCSGLSEEIGSIYFQNWPIGEWYTAWKIQQDCQNIPLRYESGNENALITEKGHYGNGLLVKYPPGKVGWSESGLSFIVPLPAGNEYTLTYKVYFEPGFQWKHGGKLPGLSGGSSTAGGYKPTGDGWSARFMWREEGELELYLYYLDMPTTYGHRFSLGENMFKQGTWYELRLTVKINHNNQANGSCTGSVYNDEGKWLRTRVVNGIKWRKDNLAPVDRLYFTTFYGGNDPQTGAPDTQTSIRFDTIKLFRN